jgi:nanoRNase/pAp phosphatase (c-di-AMP/oligoRNAs hydrolase)
MFVDQYIRNIDGRVSGFLVLKSPKMGPNSYSVSFRSIAGELDVSKVAKTLHGGGHIPAAGGKIEADSAEHALEMVKKAIDETY